MIKRVLVLMVCGLLAIGCSRLNPPDKDQTMSFTASTQDQLNEGNKRINDFKQELLTQGFRVVSSSSSDSKEQVILEGRYGELKDLKLTLWTGKRLEIKEPQLGGGIHASIVSKKAEQEFDELYRKVVFIVTGKPLLERGS
jgi:hypothetical protein